MAPKSPSSRTPKAKSRPKSTAKKAPAKKTRSSSAKKRPTQRKSRSASSKSSKRSSGSKRTRRPSSGPSVFRRGLAWLKTELLLWTSAVGVGVGVASGLLWVDARHEVRAYIAAPPTAHPMVLWSAPIKPKPGQRYPIPDLAGDLLGAGYEQAETNLGPNQFRISEGRVEIWTDTMDGPGFEIGEQRGTITIRKGVITSITPKSGLTLRPTALAAMGDLEGERAAVPLEELPKHMPDALLAIEDARFREHYGIDPIGIIRAAVHNLRGSGLHGGSTLTQQLAKNLFLSSERTVRRKLMEVFYAAALEAELDKEELLELYLTEVYLGHQGGRPIHGVERAARTWFGKSARNLTLPEAATIAGVIASPNGYSPIRHPERALVRRDQVLHRMEVTRAITPDAAAAAKEAPLTTIPSGYGTNWKSPWVVDFALDEAATQLGERFQSGEGLQIYTTVEPQFQRAAQQAISKGLADLAATHTRAIDAQGALVSINATNGHVLALVGGTDHNNSPFNRATSAWRQAGSTVKPLTMATAFDLDDDLMPTTTFEDEPLERRSAGQVWRPKNYDGTYLGEVPLYTAIEKSRNIPAVHLSERVGLPTQQERFMTAGLSKASALPSAALGAFSTTPLELATAYTLFPASGRRVTPTVLLGVLDATGESLKLPKRDRPRVVSERAALLSRQILAGVITHGTGKGALSRGLSGDLGGKTGTTDGGRDAWFAGFDGARSTVVWVGQDRGDLGLTGSQAALPSWSHYMRDTGGSIARFSSANTLAQAEICEATNAPPCSDCESSRSLWFPAEDVPKKKCTLLGLTPKNQLDEGAEEEDTDLSPREKKRRARQAKRDAQRGRQ